MKSLLLHVFIAGRYTVFAALVCLLLFTGNVRGQIVLEADGAGSTYELIDGTLGAEPEDPDCSHTSFGRHITEAFDSQLGKNVFVFHIHADIDNDRCTNFDRQRNEIKGGSGSPAGLKHTQGETAYMRWKFKLDAGFIPSSRFTHIMQIKALDGDAGAPLMTLTPRAGSPQKMEVIHSSGEGSGSQGKIAEVDLAPFKGAWVEAFMQFKSSEGSAGTFSLVIRRIGDGATLLSVSRTGIDMWRTDASFNRPKWGIYRGLDDVLRDEQVRFADFCISESSASQCPSSIGGGTAPAAPSDLSATAVSSGQINLAWTDNASNETTFRIERSTDGGTTWSLLTNTSANTTTYANTGLAASTTYHYRVRAENATANSTYANIANATTGSTTLPAIGTGTAEAENLNKVGYETNTFEGVVCARAISTALGYINGTFTGSTGNYNLTVRYLDENDGASTLTLRVNGAVVGTNTANVNDHTWKNWSLGNVTIGSGQEIRIEGAHESGEHARVDYLQVAAASGSSDIYLEAEAGTITAPMQVQSNTSASGGQYITVAAGNNSNTSAPATGRATYTFNVSAAGTYKIWGRSICPTNGDDSFWVRMDNGTWINWNEMPVATNWTWDDLHNNASGNAVVTYTLIAGSHVLDIAYREDGAQLDRILITSNLTFNPGTAISFAREALSDTPGIQVYPNPSKDKVVVSYTLVEESQVEISLFDLVQNRRVPCVSGHQCAGTYHTTLDISQLPKGMHIIRMATETNVVSHKILKE